MTVTTPAGPAPADSSTPGRGAGRRFATTRWTMVLAAGGEASPQAKRALEELCRAYWYPLYAYVRRRGHAPADAQDLTQEFFARLLARDAIAAADPAKGKFRSFLLGSLNHFLMDEWDKARAQKRGGGRVISLDVHAAEERYRNEAADALTPEKVFDQRWARALLQDVHERLRQEHIQAGKGAWFEAMRVCLAGSSEAVPHAELARQLGMNAAAVKVAAHRLRQRYRKLLREHVADTVAGPGETEEELRFLRRALAGQ